jgi:pimeloyl-ACP methyl ester carboxylesterase
MCRCAGLKVAVQACLVHDALSELGGAQVPALVVSGTLDIVAPTELSEHLTSALPQSSLVAALTSLVDQQTGAASTAAPGNEGLR